MNSAKKLLQFDFDANVFARRAPQPTTIPQDKLATLEEIVKNHDGKGSEPPNQESLREIYRIFIEASQSGTLHTEFDSPRRIRQLAWALTYSEDGQLFDQHIVANREQLQDALQLIENRFRISALLGVFDALMQAWDTPNAGMLRAFVKKHLIGYNGRRKFVQKLKTNMTWYCEENSTTQLAKNLLRSRVKLSDVWSYLELPDRMHNHRYFGLVAEAYIALNNCLDPDVVADIVEFVKKHKDDKTRRAVLSKIIEKLGHDADKELRQPVQSYALKKWGDPRITGGGNNWRYVSDEALRIFTRWITEEDIRFFFEDIAKICNDPKFNDRKDFWLSYLGETDSGHIDSCRIALHRNAEYLFRNNPYYQERKQSIARLKGGSSDQHAFIIQMGNHTFVEFSTDAACYVYENTNRPFKLGEKEYYISKPSNVDKRKPLTEIGVLRVRDKHRRLPKHRQPHSHSNSDKYYWQKIFALWIKRELGIEPLRSYLLGNNFASWVIKYAWH